MDSQRIAALTPQLLALARQAGAAILEVYRQPVEVIAKADNSPLTIADLRSHDTIVKGLAALTPDVPILSEESSDVTYATRSQWSTFWLVDPLDGTKEFLARNGQFTVNIALIEGHAPRFGVVYVPDQDLIYWGGVGFGAFRQRGEVAREQIRVRAQAPQTLRIVGSRSHGSDELTRVLPRLGDHELVPIGSSLKFCLIASGEADVYPRFGPTSEWDTAAAQAVVEGAGGKVVTCDGQPLRYNASESVLNPHFVAFGDVARDWAGTLFPK
jgi:3'(2'), 5'-bisphosphate nucleotidase